MAASRTPTRLSLRQLKRDSGTAQLDDDQSQLSAAKRTQVLVSSSIARAGLERQLASLKTDKGELERRLMERSAEVERLEQDRRWLVDREAAERKEREEDNLRWDEEKSTFLAEMRALRAALNAAKETNADLGQANAELVSVGGAHKTQVSTLTRRAEFLETELQHAHDLARQREDEIRALKDRLVVVQAPCGGKESDRKDDEEVIQAELVRQTTYLRDLERANARLTGEVAQLRERSTSVAVLKEEKRAVDAKLVAMEGLRARVAQLELEIQLQSSVSSPPAQITADAAHELSSLRLAHAQLLSEHGTLKEQLATAMSRLHAAESQTAEANSAFDALEAEKVDLEQRLSGVEVKLEASEGETKFLQDLVASYVAESQANCETLESTTPAPAHLETLLMQYRTVKESEARYRASRDGELLENRTLKLNETEAALKKEKGKLKESEERVEALMDKQNIHLAQIETLEQELFDLRGEIAGGRHVPPGVRVLQLADNPESRWAEMRQAALDRLKNENEALLKRLRELGAGSPGPAASADEGQAGGDLVPRASWELVNREKMELEEVVRQKEKRLLRLKEVYNAKGAEFRDAIASILGVKLSFRPNGEVRATSVYDLGASFAFQPARGTMQLVAQGDGGPQDLPNLMRFWIAGEQCIPGFMASVTLECYENAKRKREREGEEDGG